MKLMTNTMQTIKDNREIDTVVFYCKDGRHISVTCAEFLGNIFKIKPEHKSL